MINKPYDPEQMRDFKQLVSRYDTLYSDKVAFKYRKNPKDQKIIEVTYHDFKKDIDSLGTKLIDMGFQGKRIAIIAPNRYEWCVSYLAIETAGIIVVPLDKALPENEIESLIIRSKVDAVIFADKYLDIFKKIKEEKTSNLKEYICMDFPTTQDDILSYRELIEQGKVLLEKGDIRLSQVEIDPNAMSIMLFTSGTTSIAKAVMLSQGNICANIYAIGCVCKVVKEDTFLSFLPLHHTFESTCTFLYGSFCGITIAFCDGLRYVVSNLKDYEVTGIVSVPLMLEAMYKKIKKGIEEQGKTKLVAVMSKVCNFLLKFGIDIRRKVFKQILEQLGGHLRVIICGAAPLEKATIEGLSNLGINLLQGYGLTETSPVLAAENDKFKRPGSCAFSMPNVEIKIDQPNENGVGEIIAKGPSVMLGYYENEEATKEVLKDGWFHTGDLGYLDQDGCLFITGRKKDVIVLKNGKNIYPQELEILISKLPYVAENIVFGKPDKNGDLSLCAKIVYNDELMEQTFGTVSKEEYHDLIWTEIKNINHTMPAYKAIHEIVVTDEPLIKTTTQKVKRFEEIAKTLKQLEEK
jgi:AMP-dependent synthetase/ligase